MSWVKGVTVFARILVHCPEEALPLFTHAAAKGVRLVPPGATAATTPPAQSGEQLLSDFVGTVADSFDRVAHPGDRKLCAMGLIRATTLPLPPLLGYFELIACQVTSVWNALESGGSAVDPTMLMGGPAAEVLIDTLEVPVHMSEDAQGVVTPACTEGACSMCLVATSCTMDFGHSYRHMCPLRRSSIALNRVKRSLLYEYRI